MDNVVNGKKLRYEMRVNSDGKFITTRRLSHEDVLDKKALKEHKKNVAIITIRDMEFQADLESLVYMNSIVNLANFNYNKAVAEGVTPSEAFSLAYTEDLPWVDNSNTPRVITVADLVVGVNDSMHKIESIVVNA